jgi:hypothetical protein
MLGNLLVIARYGIAPDVVVYRISIERLTGVSEGWEQQ